MGPRSAVEVEIEGFMLRPAAEALEASAINESIIHA